MIKMELTIAGIPHEWVIRVLQTAGWSKDILNNINSSQWEAIKNQYNYLFRQQRNQFLTQATVDILGDPK